MPHDLELPFDDDCTGPLDARFDEPAGAARERAVLLAHGAGHHLASPFMEAVAAGLVARGFATFRFNYPYRQRALREGKRMLPVDRREVLEQAHRLALDALLERTDGRAPLLAGKSLGARVSTLLAAKEAPCAGLVLFGYPLHPAGKPEKLRSEHFATILQPSLFLQGTRDALCDLDLLRGELERLGGRPTLEVVLDADHSFEVLKRTGRTADEVREALLDRVVRWDGETFPA
jgi:predicted alpha/beta-hydrolase family hydrolase